MRNTTENYQDLVNQEEYEAAMASSVVYICSECHESLDETLINSLTGEEVMACPNHPNAMIDSMVL